MLDDSDLNKISEHLAAEKKNRDKKEARDILWLICGLFLGMLFVAAIVSMAGPANYKSTLADREILEIQNLSCFDLKHFTPKFANSNFVVLELLQRCY